VPIAFFSVNLEFNLSYIQRTGFPNPIIIKQHRGLGLRVPTSQFTIHDVRSCIGSQRLIDVVNVDTQESLQMTMKSWTEYYGQSPEKRSKLLNVISLEFSHTTLENYVDSPSIVRHKKIFLNFNQPISRYVTLIGYRILGLNIGKIFKLNIKIISNKTICIIQKLESRIKKFS
jgi:hypothetical protein